MSNVEDGMQYIKRTSEECVLPVIRFVTEECGVRTVRLTSLDLTPIWRTPGLPPGETITLLRDNNPEDKGLVIVQGPISEYNTNWWSFGEGTLPYKVVSALLTALHKQINKEYGNPTYEETIKELKETISELEKDVAFYRDGRTDE